MKSPSVVELTVKQQHQNGCHQNCMKFKIRKKFFTLGEKTKVKTQRLILSGDYVDWCRTLETLGYPRKLSTIINFIQFFHG